MSSCGKTAGLTVAALWIVWFLPSRAQAGVVVERVAAVVNKEIVLLTEVNERVQPYLPQILKMANPGARARALRRVQQQQLNAIIEEKLILREAVRRKLSVSAAEINRAIQSVMKQNNVGYKELVDALKAQGYSMVRYRDELRRQILKIKTINMAVRSRISVSDDDARAFYEKQKRRLGVQLRVSVQVIRIGLPMTHADRPKLLRSAMVKARTLLAAIRTGKEKFGPMARRVSDHESAPNGGRMGFVTKGKLPPRVERGVFASSAKVGALVGPVEADDGVYLARILGRKESEAQPFEKVRRDLRRQIFEQRLRIQTARWLKELRRKAYIDIRL